MPMNIEPWIKMFLNSSYKRFTKPQDVNSPVPTHNNMVFNVVFF
jgi:hypothetical protein